MVNDDGITSGLIVGLIIALLSAVVLLLYAVRESGGTPQHYRLQIEVEVGHGERLD